MDAFEAVVASILQARGFWTILNWKVELTKEEKRAIGRHSSPRWELDVLGYRGATNELVVMECKSFLDSPGVRCDVFTGSRPDEEKRYKLFFDEKLWSTVSQRLRAQLVEAGFCASSPSCQLGLAAGKVNGDEGVLKAHFGSRGWQFLGPTEIRTELRKLQDSKYENNVAAVVAKLLLRQPTPL